MPLYTQNISKIYNKRKILNEINLSVEKGEIVGLLGPNGAGKSTCFYIMIGLVFGDYGNIYLDDIDITNFQIHRRARSGIGYLPQESSVFRGLTVAQNIMAALELQPLDKFQRINRLEELLAEFMISHLSEVECISLSGGERRRVEIARCLAMNPKYILLDEPLAGIDPIAVNDIQKMILYLKSKGIGILITDHNIREALSIIDRGYILYDGNIIVQGGVDKLLQDTSARSVYFGERFSYTNTTAL